MTAFKKRKLVGRKQLRNNCALFLTRQVKRKHAIKLTGKRFKHKEDFFKSKM